MRYLYKEDIIDIIYGSTLLGAGGGGTYTLALRMLEELGKTHEIKVCMIEVEEMEDNKFGCMVAGMGSPVALEEKGFGKDAVYAFESLRDSMKSRGKELAYTYSGEYGGLSTFVSMYVSIMCGVPFVNLDGNGRAVPEMGTTLLPVFGYPSTPFALANEKGDSVIVTTADPCDTSSAEVFARHICVAHGMKIGFACWPVDRDTANEYMVPGAMDKALAVGRAIRKAIGDGRDPVDAIREAAECRELFRGKITGIEIVSKGGFDFGLTRIEDGDKVRTVIFKNENMIARDADGTVMMTVPDSICLIDSDTGIPLNNASTKEGMNVTVIGFAAADKWWELPEGYDCWRNILRAMDYDGDAVRY